jgi:hypothetical protein
VDIGANVPDCFKVGDASMGQLEIELTDPSKELSALAEAIVRAPGGQNVVQGLSKCIGISPDDPEFLDVLAALQHRIRDVELLARSASDPDFDEKMKNQVLSAVQHFAEIVHPKNANAGWDQLRSSMLSTNTITTLTFFSQTARRYKPLRVIPTKDRDEALKKLSETIEEVENDKVLKDWMKVILVDGLKRIHLVLRRLEFFGHDAAITELLLAHQKLVVIGGAVKSEKLVSHSFRTAVFAFSVVGNLLVLPDNIVTAVDHYKSWTYTWSNELLKIIIDTSELSEQRLLPPPTITGEDSPG